jgi:hypothetical protein
MNINRDAVSVDNCVPLIPKAVTAARRGGGAA